MSAGRSGRRGISFHPVGDGRVDVRQRHPITNKRTSRRCADMEAANAYADELEAAMTGGRRQGMASMRLSEFFEHYLQQHAVPNLGLNTRETFTDVFLCHIEPYLGAKRLSELSVEVLGDWRETVKPTMGAPAMQKTQVALRSVLNYAVDQKALSANPAAALKPIQVPAPAERVARTPTFVERVCTMLQRPDDRLFVRLVAYTGLRPAEVRVLREEQLIRSWGGPTLWGVRVNHSAKHDGSQKSVKNNKNHTTPLVDELAAEVNARLDRQPGPPNGRFLFPGPRPGLGMTEDDYDHLFDRFKRAATWVEVHQRGLDQDVLRRHKQAKTAGKPSAEWDPGWVAKLYDLRASFVSMHAAAGTPMALIARWVGDREETVERHYFLPRDDREHGMSPEEQIRRARKTAAATPVKRPKGGLTKGWKQRRDAPGC